LDSSSLMFDLLKPESVRKLLEEHRSGRHDNHKVLFSLVMLEQWLRGIQSKQEQPAHVLLN
jgi:asparagine synthase (glutamine-hydrolysing)